MKTEDLIQSLITLAIGIAVVILLRFLFRRVLKKSDKIHRRFLGYLLNLVVVVFCVGSVAEILYPTLQFSSLFLKGSALIVAIVGFAAQPAISDLICGFLISMNKPFEIGDRITVEGMDPAIVEDITLRHTVLRIYDGLRIVVPNSVMNSKTIVNSSFQNDRRGIHLTYSVSYDTDVQKAMDIIRDCVVASPYTLSVETNGIMEDSGPVYFLKFADSALLLETTIWVTRDTNSYIAITDVNMRVNKEFKEYGIEIPYNYINVVERENTQNDEVKVKKKKTAPSKRHFRSDTVVVNANDEKYESAMKIVNEFASRQRLEEPERMKLELMVEEIIGIMSHIVDDVNGRFWIEGSGMKYRIHIKFTVTVGSREYKKLLALSSSGRNEAAKSLSEKLWSKMVVGLKTTDGVDSKNEEYEWSLRENEGQNDDISESILASLADDIKVSVTRDLVELVIIKTV